MLIVYF